MGSATRMFAPRVMEQHGQDHAGVFTWEIDTDLFFADQAISRLFEIDPREAEKGLPLLTYLDRIHPGDRARAAKSIHDTILNGGPCQQDYRILQHKGPPIDVMAFGRCFRSRNGGLSHYAGIIHPAPTREQSNIDLQYHCLAAYAAAKLTGDREITAHLASALEAMDWPKTPH